MKGPRGNQTLVTLLCVVTEDKWFSLKSWGEKAFFMADILTQPQKNAGLSINISYHDKSTCLLGKRYVPDLGVQNSSQFINRCVSLPWITCTTFHPTNDAESSFKKKNNKKQQSNNSYEYVLLNLVSHF